MAQQDGLDFGQDTADAAVELVKSAGSATAKIVPRETDKVVKGTSQMAREAGKTAAKSVYKVVGFTVKNLQKFSLKDLRLTTQSFLSKKPINYDQLPDDQKKFWQVEKGEKGNITKMRMRSVSELKSMGKGLKEITLPGKDIHVFNQIARKHNISYSIIREPMLAADGSKLLSEAGKPLFQYHVLFKGKDGASMRRCFEEVGRTLKANSMDKASSKTGMIDIRNAVEKFTNRANEQAKHKKERLNNKTLGEQTI